MVTVCHPGALDIAVFDSNITANAGVPQMPAGGGNSCRANDPRSNPAMILRTTQYDGAGQPLLPRDLHDRAIHLRHPGRRTPQRQPFDQRAHLFGHSMTSTIGLGTSGRPVGSVGSYAKSHPRSVRAGTPAAAAARLSGSPSCRWGPSTANRLSGLGHPSAPVATRYRRGNDVTPGWSYTGHDTPSRPNKLQTATRWREKLGHLAYKST